jgi:hypothetical protein
MFARLFGGGKKPKDAPDKKFTLENLKNCWAQLSKHTVIVQPFFPRCFYHVQHAICVCSIC